MDLRLDLCKWRVGRHLNYDVRLRMMCGFLFGAGLGSSFLLAMRQLIKLNLTLGE